MPQGETVKQAQLVVVESDDRLARLLGDVCAANGWRLRQLRRIKAASNALKEDPSLVLLRLGRDLHAELKFLEYAHWSYPQVPVVAVVDQSHPELENLLWELGAACILRWPTDREWLTAVVEKAMRFRTAANTKGDLPPHPSGGASAWDTRTDTLR